MSEAATSLVVGAGRSGCGAVRLLQALGRPARWVDEKVAPTGVEGAEVRTGPWQPDWLDGVDQVVWSPGIPLTHPLAAAARERGLAVIAELELAARHTDVPMVAVTGSNGKTTTTTWIAALLEGAGMGAVAAGNIGAAFSEAVCRERTGGDRPDVYVVEVSSFQLEAIVDFHPQVAMVLNVTPDHLDRYADMAAYAATKERIAMNMAGDDTLILCREDAWTRAMAGRAGCSVAWFGLAPADDGAEADSAFLDGSMLVWRRHDQREEWVKASELVLPGRHNALNALASGMAARRLGAGAEAVRQGLRSFRGVEHRIEYVAHIAGVAWYNDSKSTNVESLKAALDSFPDPVILIAGGRDKNGPFHEVADLAGRKVAHAILIGEAAETIAAAWKGQCPVSLVGGMAAAVRRAHDLARPGQVVILSPACASFDQYRNFEHRGEDFKQLTHRLAEEPPCPSK